MVEAGDINMKIFYSDSPLDGSLDVWGHSIFLAGPTTRDRRVPSWRPDAIKILRDLNYDGQVIYPEREVKVGHIDYDTQVEWEYHGLVNCDRIVFWIPRDLETMPAFTTNVEFGTYIKSGRIVYGRPDDAPKNRYLDWLYKKHSYYNKLPIYNSLRDTLEAAVGQHLMKL